MKILYNSKLLVFDFLVILILSYAAKASEQNENASPKFAGAPITTENLPPSTDDQAPGLSVLGEAATAVNRPATQSGLEEPSTGDRKRKKQPSKKDNLGKKPRQETIDPSANRALQTFCLLNKAYNSDETSESDRHKIACKMGWLRADNKIDNSALVPLNAFNIFREAYRYAQNKPRFHSTKLSAAHGMAYLRFHNMIGDDELTCSVAFDLFDMVHKRIKIEFDRLSAAYGMACLRSDNQIGDDKLTCSGAFDLFSEVYKADKTSEFYRCRVACKMAWLRVSNKIGDNQLTSSGAFDLFKTVNQDAASEADHKNARGGMACLRRLNVVGDDKMTASEAFDIFNDAYQDPEDTPSATLCRHSVVLAMAKMRINNQIADDKLTRDAAIGLLSWVENVKDCRQEIKIQAAELKELLQKQT